METCLFSVVSSSPEETIAAGERIAALLHTGSVVALRGGLGVGKTWLTKGIARGLGVTEEVTSPTYTIISEYEGCLPLYHIDAYRLRGNDDFAALGADDALYGNGVTVIEWSERIVESIPDNALTIEISILKDARRLIAVKEPRYDYTCA
ncbi:MAG: tRNA (adenosine(37)-N6)-threonylcarbamoyltransferase complex ATPase subunit type 1 TsaE [Treponema sp.]|jgi:tRNA threonylcarbamoyladenosine biosynthesis protein TsaE|nr:tRNA (adenosine(37)-N6)-threonylcarbamoyltransferase complex ATPase subunit type 1 TsaE [Treponema sp.]